MQDTALMLHTLLELGESMLADGADVRRVSGALYGALYKLKDYEETGLSPDEVRAMLDEKNG